MSFVACALVAFDHRWLAPIRNELARRPDTNALDAFRSAEWLDQNSGVLAADEPAVFAGRRRYFAEKWLTEKHFERDIRFMFARSARDRLSAARLGRLLLLQAEMAVLGALDPRILRNLRLALFLRAPYTAALALANAHPAPALQARAALARQATQFFDLPAELPGDAELTAMPVHLIAAHLVRSYFALAGKLAEAGPVRAAALVTRLEDFESDCDGIVERLGTGLGTGATRSSADPRYYVRATDVDDYLMTGGKDCMSQPRCADDPRTADIRAILGDVGAAFGYRATGCGCAVAVPSAA